MVMPLGVTRNPTLPENLAKLFKGANVLHIPTNAGWTSTVVNGGTTSMNLTYLSTADTAQANSSAMLDAICAGFNLADTSWIRINWDKRLYLVFNWRRGTSNAEAVGRFQLKQAATIGAMADEGIGIRADNLVLVGESYGASLGELDLATNLTVEVITQIAILHYPGVKIEWYVNGVLKGTQTTAAKIPSGIGGATCSLVSSCNNGAAVTAAATQVFHPKIWQER